MNATKSSPRPGQPSDHNSEVKNKRRRPCHDCSVAAGKFHTNDCDYEKCPFCGGQLVTCNCCYEQLKIPKKDWRCPIPTWALLPPKQLEEWKKILNKKGRFRYGQEPEPDVLDKMNQKWRRAKKKK